uniref:Uncharacterized protein n=1 Tax=Ditylenchus dipsaci TaxID=166011 RepID=A0A915DIF8_9BILA
MSANPYAQLKNSTDCFANASLSPKLQEALAKRLNQVYKLAIGDVLACVIAFVIITYVLLVADDVNRNIMQLLDGSFVSQLWLKFHRSICGQDANWRLALGKCTDFAT